MSDISEAWEPIFSEHVDAISFNRESRQLKVRFTDGSEYGYDNVDAEAVDMIRSSPSTGQYFNRVFKRVYTGYRI